MITFLNLFDAFLCALVVIAAADYLRRIRPSAEPLLAASFYLVAIGAFGSLAEILRGTPASYPEALLHFGVASYAWSHRHFMFEAVRTGGEQRPQGRRRAAQQ